MAAGTRRIGAAIIGAFALGGVLSIRLFSVSVLDHRQYLAEADRLQQTERDILPRRGTIYLQDAASGQPVVAAQSVERYSLSVTPKNVTKKEAYAAVLAQAAGMNEGKLLAQLKGNGLYLAPLAHGLSQEDVKALADRLNAVERQGDPAWQDASVDFDTAQGDVIYFIGGVYFTREYERAYPEGPLLSQALGFVNDQGQGQYGFEAEYDGQLKGYAGQALYETDSLGTLLSQKAEVQGKNGTDYLLTVDRNVQYEVERELAAEIKDSEAKGGSVIVMDPKTGGIIAMASSPTYDVQAFRDVSQADIGLFDNPAISKIWEPGSIFKPLVMSAALDKGLVTPQTSNTFDESVTVEGHKIETALRRSYGTETMAQVLANSDNVAMVWVADKLGNDAMYQYLKGYGFGAYTGIDLKNEISGELPALAGWRDINRATISFGQGIAVTPMQMVAAYAAIANDGRMVKPHIVQAVLDPDGTQRKVATEEGAQVIKPETAKELRDMMVYTVEQAHNRAGTPGYKIGGKTGTAQVPDPVNGGYVEDAYNHSFVGIGPSDDPKYVVLVKIDEPNLKKVGTFAESTAVPLFGKISTFLLHYYQIPPTNG